MKYYITCKEIILLLMTFVFISIVYIVPANADLFYFPWEYNSLYNEKVALELELKSLKRQLKNEVSGLESKIRKLEDNIENLNMKLELAQKKMNEDSELYKSRVKELENIIAILKNKSGVREQELIKENKRLQDQCQKTIDELHENIQREREANIEEYAKLKDGYENKITKMESQISNLKDELSNIKKLTESQKLELNRMSLQADELEKHLKEEIERGEIRLKKMHEKIIINIDDRICFDTGRAILKKDVLPALDKIAKILSDFPENRILIEGHTDDVPISNVKFRDNWQLSTERSLAVLNYLLKNAKLSPSRLTAEGYGEYHPIVPNNTPENRSLNRRVDIVVVPRLELQK